MSKPRISVVLVAYDMARELPRTVLSLGTPYQRGLRQEDIELIVVDNGSPAPVQADALQPLHPDVQVLRVDDGGVSPCRGINRALARARADLVGVCIDGARLASPGLLRAALHAACAHPRPAIGCLSRHLGPDLQSRSMLAGYDQAAEDALLAGVGWPADGYRLFDVSVLAGSSRVGPDQLPAETNALFLPRAEWDALGGYDERFVSPGGGLANLDTWLRAVDDPGRAPILLEGEATFHQIHGGVATNAPRSRWEEFHAEYRRLRGKDFVMPDRRPWRIGSPAPGPGAG